MDTGLSNPIMTADVGTLPGTASAGTASAGTARDTPEAIAKAATQFEALLIGEVLKSSREADGSGWMGTDADEAGSTLMELSEQQISQALATSGGLGLAKMIATGLAATSGHGSRPTAAPAERKVGIENTGVLAKPNRRDGYRHTR